MKTLFQTEDKLKKAATSAQKDKFEKEIKQEVKKLQRIRDFVKQKESEKDFRDMDKLYEMRTHIETVTRFSNLYRLWRTLGTMNEISNRKVTDSKLSFLKAFSGTKCSKMRGRIFSLIFSDDYNQIIGN